MAREPVICAAPGNDRLAAVLRRCLTAEMAPAAGRLDGCDAVVAATAYPAEQRGWAGDAAADLRARGARTVGLVAPYLAPDVGVSPVFDWLVTVATDRHQPVPTRVVDPAPDIASWLVASMGEPAAPAIVALDPAREPLVAEVARAVEAPYGIFDGMPASLCRGRTPVLIADTGAGMVDAALALAGTQPPLCIAVHAIFPADSYRRLWASGVRSVISCETIEHPSNAIDFRGRIADAAASLITAA